MRSREDGQLDEQRTAERSSIFTAGGEVNDPLDVSLLRQINSRTASSGHAGVKRETVKEGRLFNDREREKIMALA